MWHKLLARGFARTVAWLLLLVVVVTLSLLIALGNEGGSRWLLDKALGMQTLLTMEVVRGDLMSGITARNVHIHGKKFDLYIGQVMLRWSLEGLLRAQLQIDELQADKVRLVLPAHPPTHHRTVLPKVVLPFKLLIVHGEIRQAGIEKPGHYWGLDRLSATQVRWVGSRITVGEADASQALGQLSLRGAIRLAGDYDIDASGQLALNEFRRQGLLPLRVQVAHNLGDLGLVLDSGGKLPAHGEGSLDTLDPDLPYRANLRWQAFKSPWFAAQGLSSAGGNIQAEGNLHGLQSTGNTNLSGVHVPLGQYRWQAKTDWKSVDVDALNFAGLGGEAVAKGRVDWHQGLLWQADMKFNKIDAARKWPALKMLVPVLTGTLSSKGQTSEKGSAISLKAVLAHGERWEAELKSASWPWHLDQRQALQARWENVDRRLPGVGALTSSDGHLQFDGTLKDYRLALQADAVSDKTPAGVWRLDVNGHDSRVDVSRLDYDGEVGSATFAGQLELKPQLHWEGALVVNNFQSGWLLPDWSGQYSGSINTQGQWSPTAHEINLSNIFITGTLRDQPLAINGGAAIGLPLAGAQDRWPRVKASDLEVIWGANQLRADGGMTTAWDLRLDGKLHDPALIDPRFSGQVNFQANINGDRRQPSATVHVDGQDLSGLGASLKSFAAEASVSKLGYEPGQIMLQANGLIISGREVQSINLTAQGSRESHELSWMIKTPQVQTEGRLTGQVDLEARDWKGRLESGVVHIPDMDWTLDSPVAASWSTAERSLRVSQHCWSSGPAHLCNEDELIAGPAGHVKVRLTGMEAERLQGHMPEGLVWKGQISGNADANWQEGELPELSVNLLTQAGGFDLAREEGGAPLHLGYNLVALQAFIRPDDWRLRFDLISPDMGSGYADVHVDPHTPDHGLKGETTIEGMRLDVLQPFFPALSTLSGQVGVNGQIGGLLKQPQFWGQLKLDKGLVVAREAPINLHDVSLQADIHGQSADISGQMGSGDGKANLTGTANWAEAWKVSLALKGNDFEVKQEPMLVARVDPDLTLELVPNQIDISGKVTVPYARVNIKQLPEKAIPLSPDVEVINVDQKTARAQLTTAMRSWLINAGIDVILGDDVAFNGFGVIGKLGGNVKLTQRDKRGLQANGQVELGKEARYDACGQKLQITTGRLIFAGPITQPGIALDASKTTADDKTVGLRVSGRANAPEISFYSDANLSQEEIISYLVFGRPLYQNGQLNVGNSSTSSTTTSTTGQGGANSGGLAMAFAAFNLGTCNGSGGGLADKVGVGGLANRIGGVFGFSDVAVGSEATSTDTQVTVSGYLNPKLYLSYGVGVFTPVNTVKVRYNLTQRFYVQAVSSLENAIDLYYTFKF